MKLILIDEYAWYPPGVKEAIQSIQTERYEMKTANRRPRLNKKPSRGLKKRLHQAYKGMKKAMALAAGPTKSTGQKWYTHKAVRASWLLSLRGSHMPHQGGQEKARRVRQMAEHKCINPECWT